MTIDEVIRLARESGFRTGAYNTMDGLNTRPFIEPMGWGCLVELERFAALVASEAKAREYKRMTRVALRLARSAVKAEREECAGICDRFAAREMHPAECAGAIRARGKK